MKALLFLFLSMGAAVAGISKVDVDEARKLIADGVQVLDVRTLEEWNEGHLEGAMRADVTGKDFGETVAKKVDPGKPVLVYCRSGSRSARASKAMEKLGFGEIHDLKGGITAWRKAGGKVVK